MHSPEAQTAEPCAPAAEQELVRSVLERDRKATAEFVQLHADAVYSYVNRRLYPRNDQTDDLVQEIFLSALESLPQFKGTSTVRGWLMGIARHRVQDYYRDRLREISLEESDAEPAAENHFEDWIHEQQLEQRIQTILAELPESYRLVLFWRYWEKCSAAEMAGRLAKTEKAVERLLMRAREQFRRRWYSE